MCPRISRPFRGAIAAAFLALLAAKAVAGPNETTIHAFGSVANPESALIADASGAFYGTIYGGTQYLSGSVFKLTPPAAGNTTWTEEALYRFKGGTDGANPSAALIADASGALYGTTEEGGGAGCPGVGCGTVFKLTPPAAGHAYWAETVLHRFKGGTDGSTPYAALIADASGALYGTTLNGGRGGKGTVFRLTPPAAGKTTWTETVLHAFKGGAYDGAYPYASLIADASGALYGTTNLGGRSNSGTVFKLTPPATGQTAWTRRTLYNFKGHPDSGHPRAALIFDASGNLYGTTLNGGPTLQGTVFKLSPPATGKTAWTETVLHSFNSTYHGSGDGATPNAALIFDASGALYGTTESGGTLYIGTVFKLTPPATGQTAWSETVLHSFTGFTRGTDDGTDPNAALIADASGALYGTTRKGGRARSGIVFKLTPPAPGQTGWTEAVLHDFTEGSDGSGPVASLIADASGALYGTTEGGGNSGWGTAFKLTPPAAGQTTWTETLLHSFNWGSGGAPFAALATDASGALYGTTVTGGASGWGTVFKLTPPAAGEAAWARTVLYSFAPGTGGYDIPAGVITDASGALYGTTEYGGGGTRCPPYSGAQGEGCGTVFKLTPPVAGQTAWTETVLHAFTVDTDGANPLAGLIADASGALYGTTSAGGPLNLGTVFKLTPPASGKAVWTETVLHRFKGGTDGANPYAALIADATGALYGTTLNGGKDGKGTAFKLTPPATGRTAWTGTVLHAFAGGSDGANPYAALIAVASGALYGTTGAGGPSNAGTVFKLTPPAAGQTAWTETVSYAFGNVAGDGTGPRASLLADANGALYGTTSGGGQYDGGTVFKLTP